MNPIRPVISLPWHLKRFAALPLLLAASAGAQSTLGSITGTVQDPTGAVVPNATVRLHRLESNTDLTAIADANGSYTALNVPAGHYDITVTTPGFAPTTARNVALDARQQLRFDVTEKPGATADAVTVNASDTGLINTENAQISAALSPQSRPNPPWRSARYRQLSPRALHPPHA